MKRFSKAALTALLLAGAAVFSSAPARADWGIGFSFGTDDTYYGDPCDYYDYYDAAPPWGLPPDYCEYPVYFGEVYWGDTWYRGPIYYRWANGQRMYWINGGWRRHQWHGGGHPRIQWHDRGGWSRGYGHGYHDRGVGYRDGGGHRDGGPGYSGRGGGSRDGGPGYSGRGRGDGSGNKSSGRGGSGGKSGPSSRGGGGNGGGHGGHGGGHR